MRLNLFFHLLWMLCAVGTAVFAVVPAASSRLRAGALILGFVLGLVYIFFDRLPDPAVAGVLAALVAVGALIAPRVGVPALVTAGIFAGVWSALLHAQGLPTPVAMAVAAALPLLAVTLSVRRPAFAPDILKGDAVLVVLVLAIATAVGPGVADGWRSARALNLAPQSDISHVVPWWSLLLVAGTASLGGLYSLWMRR